MNRIVILAIILTAVLLTARPSNAVALDCQRGTATMHGAWYQVFTHFPERFDPNVAGFIAVNDCDRMGDLAVVRVGHGRWWLVRVADCRNKKHKAAPGWIADVDSRLWAADRIPVMPMEAILCFP